MRNAAEKTAHNAPIQVDTLSLFRDWVHRVLCPRNQMQFCSSARVAQMVLHFHRLIASAPHQLRSVMQEVLARHLFSTLLVVVLVSQSFIGQVGLVGNVGSW